MKKLLGFKTSQWGVEWPVLREMWLLGDSMPEFDSGWLFDHFVGIGPNEQATEDGSHEGWSAAAALGALTTRIQFGHLVLGNTHRHPALLARMAATIDHIAGPHRFVVGLGAGWQEHEHTMFGWELPPLGERLTRLDAAVRILKGMWSAPDGFSMEAGPYRLQDATCRPGPITPGGPPIWLGTQGLRRGLRIVAERADGWNANGDFDSFLVKRDALLRHCEEAGRDPAEVLVSAQLICGERTAAEVVEAARGFLDAGVDHMIFAIRASDGPDGLRALAQEVIAPLRERYG